MPEEPAGYPPHWEADVVASDGGTVHLRPIRPEDAEQLVAMHARTSVRTRYMRFFGAYPRIPEKDLYRFTHVDHRDRVAFVVYLGTSLIAVGRYDRLPDTDDAEVAFLVEDEHQGRGIGPVLLEHLAAAARENGIRRFVAEILAENARMVRVFREAGFSSTQSFEEGVVHLEFPIEPTESSVAVAYEREQRAESRSLARLLTPGSVAVIGASNDPSKVGHVVLRNLLGYGFNGPIYPVHPTARHVSGVPAYSSVTDIPGDLDLAILAVPAEAVAQVVEECGQKRVRGLVVVSGGFGERDDEGRSAEQRLVAAARGHGMRVVGPNCLGLINTDPSVRVNASLSPYVPDRGRVGFFCQSGALGVAILQNALSRGLGMSTFVSAGNRADVSGNDLLQYWTTDADTEVVLLHLESFGNPRKFARLARRLGRMKPVVAVKSGRHAGVIPALAKHSVRMSEESVQTLFESAGVIRVETLAQMFDVAMLLAHQPLPPGPRVAIVGNSSALGLLVADACLANGLVLAKPAPVDIGPDGSAAAFEAALRDALDDDDVDALVAVFVPPLATEGTDYASVLADVGFGRSKPVVSTFLGLEGVPEQLRRRGDDGEVLRGSVPSYPSPERAVLALARSAQYAEWRRRPVGAFPDLPGIEPEAARSIVDEVLAATPGGRRLEDDEARALLAAYGIEVLPSATAGSAEEAVAAAGRIGYPVALKSTAPELRDRTDLGGARLDVADETGVRAAYSAMSAAGTGRGEVIVQAMADKGVAVAVGVVDDPSFGALVSVGIAGVASDLLGDRAFRSLPVTDRDAAELVREPRAYPLLAGYRGSEPVDIPAVEDLVLRVARLADDLPEVLDLVVDPVIVSATGRSVAAATIRVGPPTSRVAPGPRRLADAG